MRRLFTVSTRLGVCGLLFLGVGAELTPGQPTPSSAARHIVLTGVQECVRIAIEKYRPAWVAQEQLRLAEVKISETRRAKFPTAAVKWTESGGTISNQEFEGRKVGIEVQQPILHFGRLRYATAQAEVNLDIARYNYYRVTGDLVYRIQETYYRIARLSMNLESYATLLREARSIYALAKKEYALDLMPELELLEVESQYQQLMFQIEATWKALLQERIAFSQLLRLDPSMEMQPESLSTDWLVEDSRNIKKRSVQDYIEMAMDSRPDLAVGRLMVKFGELGKRLVRSQEMPKVDLIGSLFRSGEAFVDDSLDLDNEWFMGFQVRVPLGPNTVDYNYNKDRVARRIGEFRGTESFSHDFSFNLYNNMPSPRQESLVEYEQSISDLEELEDIIESEVHQAFFDMQNSSMQYSISESRMVYRQRELAVIEQRLALNDARLSDLLSAKISVHSEQLSGTQALSDYYVARVNLDKAIGRSNSEYQPSESPLLW